MSTDGGMKRWGVEALTYQVTRKLEKSDATQVITSPPMFYDRVL